MRFHSKWKSTLLKIKTLPYRFHSSLIMCQFCVYLRRNNNHDMSTVQRMKAEQIALKMYIFVCGIGLTIYTGIICFGVRTPIAEWLSMTFGFILLTGGAWMYHLCWLSYATIAYIYMVRCFMLLGGIMRLEGIYDIVLRWSSFLIGIVLCLFILNRILAIIINRKYNNHVKSKIIIESADEDGSGRE